MKTPVQSTNLTLNFTTWDCIVFFSLPWQGQVLSEVIDRAGYRGIMVVLDMHNLGEETHEAELWWSDKSTYHDYQRGWANLVRLEEFRCGVSSRSN